MSDRPMTHDDMRQLLATVGLDPVTTPNETYDQTFEALELDSLARLHLATQIQDRFGVDLEDELRPETAPSSIPSLLAARFAPQGAAL